MRFIYGKNKGFKQGKSLYNTSNSFEEIKMILERTPLNMNEVQEILKNIPDSEKKEQMDNFLKKFLNTKKEQAKKIKEGIEKLDLLKIKTEHIVKIVDMLPEDASDINKIFADVSLNEDETNKILEVVKNNK